MSLADEETPLTEKPRIALVLGDPGGVGPEITAKMLADDDARNQADIVLLASLSLFNKTQKQAGVEVPYTEAASFGEAEFSPGTPVLIDPHMDIEGGFPVGTASVSNGSYALQTMRLALDLTSSGQTDAMVFAPLNKESLHLAGMTQGAEVDWFAERIGYDGYACEINVLEEVWTARVTSHIPLRDVAGMITPDRVCRSIRLIDETLRQADLKHPRIAVAALNPHAGDGGNFGTEETDVIAPGIEMAAQHQIAATGPLPSDTVFLKALAGDFDAVVTMYHDQGQIAMKLTGFDRGVTIMGGLPVPIATPAHGSAFDIAGKGVANAAAMRQAFDLACRMSLTRHRVTS